MTNKRASNPNILLRQARDAEKLTQQDLADKIKTTKGNVGRWERGEVFPSAYFRSKLCEFFHKSYEELGLIREQYLSASEEEEEEPEAHEDIPPIVEQAVDLQQASTLPRPKHFGTKSLLFIIMSLIFIIAIIGGSILVFGRRTPANPPLGSPIFNYQVAKIGSYDTLINALAWSPDSSSLACAIGDHTALVLNIATEEEITVFHGHSNNVNSVVWLPNGRQVASASTDQTVQIWDAFTGHALIKFLANTSVMALAVSSDGKKIAWSGKDGITQVWSIVPKEHLFTYDGQAGSSGIWGLAFSHNDKLLAAGDNTGDIQIFDAQNGQTVLNYHGHTKSIYGLDWSPDNHFIASASGDGFVRVWNTASGKTVHTYTHNMVAMQAVSWSPDGTHVASASEDGTVQVWNAFSQQPPFIYHHHSGTVFTVAWSPDGKKIASGDASGDIQVWWAI